MLKSPTNTSNDEYIFTADGFSGNIPVWLKLLAPLKGRANLRFLEIGSYEGRASVWLLNNVLTHETAHLTCIDTFEGAVEASTQERSHILESFKHNIRGFGRRVDYFVGESRDVLRDLPFKDHFAFIYLNGDHKASSVLEDAILAFRMLKPRGVLVFDDYCWRLMHRDIDRPKLAIDVFTHIFSDDLDVVFAGAQIAVIKRPTRPTTISNR